MPPCKGHPPFEMGGLPGCSLPTGMPLQGRSDLFVARYLDPTESTYEKSGSRGVGFEHTTNRTADRSTTSYAGFSCADVHLLYSRAARNSQALNRSRVAITVPTREIPRKSFLHNQDRRSASVTRSL